MKYLSGKLTLEEIRKSELYQRGDCVNVWVNEGDLALTTLNEALLTRLQSQVADLTAELSKLKGGRDETPDVRCLITGNPVGTDTRSAGSICPCNNCTLAIVVDPRAVALEAAVSALYFDDSSDYSSALFSVVAALDVSLAELLTKNPSEAYAQSSARLAESQLLA